MGLVYMAGKMGFLSREELVLGLVYMAGKMGFLNREVFMGVYMAANLGMFLWISREDNNSLGPKMDEIGA